MSDSGGVSGMPGPTDSNVGYYRGADLVGSYDTGDLRSVEAYILDRYRDDFSGRVLEVGCGGGRLIRRLVGMAPEVHGIDISAAMVAHCRDAYPEAEFSQMDMRDLGKSDQQPFDAVLASFNILDAVDHADRRLTLAGFRSKLAPGGLLVMSSHNIASAPSVPGPAALIVAQVRARRFRAAAGSVVRYPRRARNRRRLRKRETSGPDYAIVNDPAHDYSLLHHYVSVASQVRQLSAHGFQVLESLDLSGRPLEAGDDAPDCSEIHYVARVPLT